MVFCGSKKSTETLAELLSQRIRLQYTFSPQDVDLIRGIQDAKLRELVYRGVAFHHAGLPPSDKVILEQLYCLRKILILTCTSTLAFGVNLPAHLVIVKGTSHYRGIFSTLSPFRWSYLIRNIIGGEGYVRLPRSMVLQMIGRAGRQGLDTNGVAVVMTNDEDKAYFQSNIMDTVESTLPSRLVETICSEICQSVNEIHTLF